MVTEFALAIVLLVGAGLLVRSWWHVNTIDPGFKPERVLVMQITPPPTVSAPAQRTNVYLRVLEQIQAVPGVESAGIIDDLFSGNQGLEREPLPQMFVSLAQNHPPSNVALFIRTSSDDPLAMAGALRAAARRVEKDAPTYGVALLEQQLGTYLTQRRFQTSLLAGFSVAALLIAAVGIYGLIQYSIATRTREIGLRIAIGAQRGDIFRMIIGEGLTLSLTGLALGLVGALWLGRAGSSLLFGVTASDPLTFTTVSLLLTAVAIAACYFPARRAMTVDPIVALRVT